MFWENVWNIIWLLFWSFAFVAYLFALFAIIGDLFRDQKLNGWWKAVWIIFLIFLPFLGTLVYLIARGSGMQERALAAQQEAQKQLDAYVKQTAEGGSAADELTKLAKLHDEKKLSDEEFERAKAKIVA
jgi:ABC-type multidrug transport system fused ATPase/permease subunit